MGESQLPNDEPGARESWRRSSRCAVNGCVEVDTSAGTVRVRDSKHPDGPVLTFGVEEWRAFVVGVKGAEFDV
jgi:hypothetical protein